MARFAIVVNGITSTTTTGLELARRLTERGHHPTLVCHADLRRVASEHEIGFERLTADRAAFAELWATVRTIKRLPRPAALRALVGLPGQLRRARRRTAAAVEFHEVIGQIDPDVIVVDTEAHVAAIASVANGVPVVLTTFLFDIEPKPSLPPLDSTLMPGDSGIAAAWQRNLADGRRARRRRRLTRLGVADAVGPISYASNGLPALRAVARAHGIRLADVARTDGWLRPVWYPHVPTLSTNLSELEFGTGPSAPWTYVGPMVAPPDAVEPTHRDEDHRRWQRLVAERLASENPPVLVYCSLGTYRSADRGLLLRVAAAVARRSDLQLVVGLGGKLDPAELGELPENVLALGRAPQREVLQHAALAIVHGGNATLNECVVAGVPMVACSTGFLDQNGVCARIEHAGIGVRIDRSATPGEIIDSIDRVLSDSAMRASIDRWSALARDPERQAAAVRLLEGMVPAGGASAETTP